MKLSGATSTCWRVVGAVVFVAGVLILATCVGSWAWLLGWGVALAGLAGVCE